MHIEKQAGGFKSTLITILIMVGIFANMAQASGAQFRLERDAQGLFKPFKALSVPLPDFLREYSRLAAIPMTADGSWDTELKGSVTLFLKHALKPEEMTEIVYQVLSDNGYAALDAPAGNGWIIMRNRDARDGPIPVLEASDVPPTARLLTVHISLKYANGDMIARTMRSFMPANSRILSTEHSQLLITDTGLNIRKILAVISRMDTAEVGEKEREMLANYSANPPRSCGEQRIEKLVVEKLEIQDSSNIVPPGPNGIVKHIVEGGKK